MKRSLRLGRVAGIEIRLHWSLLLIFWLILWELAAGYLPAAAPSAPAVELWLVAAAASLLFYASLLAHELSHGLVSRSRGIAVQDITLWLFGGVARLKGEPDRPGSEALISLAGPLTSVVAAGVFAALSLTAPAGGGAAAGLVWLASINLVLALFNLIPALPLDGGRVLHAIVWRLRGDREAATRIAATAGEVFAWVLIGLGVVELIGGNAGGLWLLLLGWFLQGAASAEERSSTLRGALAGLTVGDVMTRDPVGVPATLSAEAFIQGYALRYRFSTFPVLGPAGEPLGLVTLKRVAAVRPEERASTAISRLLEPLERVATASPAEPAADLLERLGDDPGRALVLDRGHVVGLVAPADFTFALRRRGLAKGGGLGRAA